MARSDLGFARRAIDRFDFLESGSGLRLADVTDTRVRWESDRRFVNVFHGRGSYEIGVEFGRWVDVNGERQEQAFSLPDFLAARPEFRQLKDHGWAATNPATVARMLDELAEAAHRIAPEALSNGDALFDLVSMRNRQRSTEYLEGVRASRLREKAETAWHRRDFPRVVDAYAEIVSELNSVTLRPSELARLKYAERAVAD